MRLASTILLPLLIVGCAGGQGTHPHDMSQAGHEQMAQQEEQEAAAHEAMPEEKVTECTPPGRTGTVCWTVGEDHEAEAKRHRELAAKHRAASAALAQAEAEKCAGIPDADRDMSPFAHVKDISSVTELKKSEDSGEYAGPSDEHLRGVTVTFKAVPGMTKEWLQRVIDCHLARNASVGFKMEGMGYCPLAIEGAKATVRSAQGGFAVDITADKADKVDLIVSRAENLKK